jgi:hypothetical protein
MDNKSLRHLFSLVPFVFFVGAGATASPIFFLLALLAPGCY